MGITTSKGNRFEAVSLTDSTWDGSLQIVLEDSRPLSEIATAFEGLTSIQTEDEREYTKVTHLTGVIRMSDICTQVRLI